MMTVPMVTVATIAMVAHAGAVVHIPIPAPTVIQVFAMSFMMSSP